MRPLPSDLPLILMLTHQDIGKPRIRGQEGGATMWLLSLRSSSKSVPVPLRLLVVDK